MNKFISKIKEMFRSMKFRERMLLIYFIGAFIPILIILLNFNENLSDIQMEQMITNSADSIKMEAELEASRINMAIELSEKIHYNSADDKLIIDKYLSGRDLKVSYHNFDEFEYYYNSAYKDVESVSIYLNPEVVEGKKLIDNRRFKLITSTVKSKEWYMRAMGGNGEPSWSYSTNIDTNTRNYRMARPLYNENGINVGVISISIKYDVVGSFIDSITDDGVGLLIYNNSELLTSSENLTEGEVNLILDQLKNKDSHNLKFRNETCIITSAKVYPRNAKENYTLVKIERYDKINSENRKRIIMSYAPLFAGVIIMTFAIFVLINWFSKRMRSLVRAMRRVTYGNYNVEDTEIEKYYDEIFDLYNALKTLVSDMQGLQDMAAKERIQKEQMISRQKEVEFKMLATQINPHFLYNTLENIRMMATVKGEKDIADMCFNLTKLLRKTLSAGKGLRSLLWEMEMVENYITIQNYRFGERIRAVIDYDKNKAVDYEIIPFVIQPFVENAYVHAMESMEGGGLIVISATIGEDINLIIEDNGCGMPEEKLQEVTKYLNDFENIDRTHIGIVNVNQRIKLQFGDEYGVDFTSTEGKGTKVVIKLPVIERET